MNLDLPFRFQIKGHATSEVTPELVEKQLVALRAQPQSDETKQQIEYLEAVKQRKGWT